MESNTKLSVLEPEESSEPSRDLSQIIPGNDNVETTTINDEPQISSACVNIVNECEIGVDCTAPHPTPASDELSISSGSHQSSISEHRSDNRKTFEMETNVCESIENTTLWREEGKNSLETACADMELEIIRKNKLIRNKIEEMFKKKEIPCWEIISIDDWNWEFAALWNSLRLSITLPVHHIEFRSELRFLREDDEILTIAISPIICDYGTKIKNLCSDVEDVIIFMEMLSPRIKFAENFALDFSNIIDYENIILDNGIASFELSHCDFNFYGILRATVEVDMNNISVFFDSSIKVKQDIGYIAPSFVRHIFFNARGDYDFFSKFIKELKSVLIHRKYPM